MKSQFYLSVHGRKCFKKVSLLITVLALGSTVANAQMKVGASGAPNSAAMMEIVSPGGAGAGRGLLQPKISLSVTTTWGLAGSAVSGMCVYNTNASMTGTTSYPILPGAIGLYYWDGTGWVATGAAAFHSGYWSTTGNASTVDGTNFIGTTDNIPFSVKVNNQKAGRIDHLLFNTILGYQAGNSVTGSKNTMLGHLAGNANTSGHNNIFLGYNSGFTNTTGIYNTLIGDSTGLGIITGSNNTIIGSRVTGLSSSLANNIILADGAGVVRLQIANTGAAKLPAYGSGTFTGTPTKALQVDASGNIIEGSLTGNFWSITGNAGTVDGTNFIGTTDNIPFNIKVNNRRSGRIDNTNKNVTLGYNAFPTASTGTNVTAIGDSALSANTSGGWSVAVGANALKNNTTGLSTVAVGSWALEYNTTGNWNTAVGENSLNANTTGTSNTGMGEDALAINSTGIQNTGLGAYALKFNTASWNTAVGYNTNGVNTTGNSNTSIGWEALVSNTTGNKNVAVGESALFTNIAGNNNTVVGEDALYYSTGGNNTGLGYYAGVNVSTGTYNTFVGDSTGIDITTGSNNTIIGSRVLGLSSSLANNIILADGSGNKRLQINSSGDATFTGGATSTSASAGIGYATGAGGTVTQATNKSTGVTLSKMSGTITMNAAALAAGTIVSFTVTNTGVAATDVVYTQHDSGGTLGSYTVSANTMAAGSYKISVRNNTAGSLSEAIVIRFVVIKAANN